MADRLEVCAQRDVPRDYPPEYVERITGELIAELHATAASRGWRLGRTVELWVQSEGPWEEARHAIIRAVAPAEPLPVELTLEEVRARRLLTVEEHRELAALSAPMRAAPEAQLTPAQLLDLLQLAPRHLAERLLEHLRALGDDADRCYVEDHPRQVAYWRERALLAEAIRPSKPYRGARSA